MLSSPHVLVEKNLACMSRAERLVMLEKDHLYVSNLLDAGVDIATVAKMAGHANIQITARYDRSPEEAKQRAARLLYIP